MLGEDGAPPLSQEHLALVFANLNAERLRHVADWGLWLVWDGSCWRKDRTLLVSHLVREVVRDAAEKTENMQTKHRLCTAASSSAVERLAASDQRLSVPSDVWDSDPLVLNTSGGLVELRTGELRNHEPSAHCTKATRVGPEAAEPHRWLLFLDEVTGSDPDYIAYLQRMCGYFLTGDTSEHALFFAWGSGRNGKSVFTNILRYVMGDYATSTPMDTLTASTQPQHPTDLADLRGARLVTAQETQGGRRWAEAKIKQMTGGDPIKARFMRQDFFEYLPQFKLFIAGNHQPGLSTVDEAMRRRIHLLPFTVTIPKDKVDKKLEEKLCAEAPAILNWMLEGCLRWRTDGLEPPAKVRQATQEYLEGEDVIGRWIADCCTTDQPKLKEPVKILHESYVLWCETNGERYLAKNAFSKAVRERGFANDNVGGIRGFIGLKVRDDIRAALAKRNRDQDDMPF